MGDVNSRQVDGTHYRSTYQHWDFVQHANLDYLLGCATKYIARWRRKNGTPDLEKAIHYLEKYMDVNAETLGAVYETDEFLGLIDAAQCFSSAADLNKLESKAILAITLGHYFRETRFLLTAKYQIESLLSTVESEPNRTTHGAGEHYYDHV